uniref:Tudor staphylococcal nuclease n=1 Tax=Piliocolobus tephrosceles TaxID=591936 RepID=A0A8C9GNL4_9PRIM
MFQNKRMKCVIDHIRDGSNFRVSVELDQNGKKKMNQDDKNNTSNEIENTLTNNSGSNNNKKKKNETSRKKKNSNNNSNENLTDKTVVNSKYLTVYYFSFTLCGIIVDMFKKEVINNVETVKEEIYASETKKFVETRLLNRDIEFEIKHMDNNNNLYGNIYYKLGNICISLLKNGYAYINDYTINYVENPLDYKKALKEAIHLRKKRWINYSEKKVDYEKEYHTTVIEVVFGDVIIVDYENEERRLYLASIKCEKHSSDLRNNSLCIAAKNFLKNQIVGQKVKIVTEYIRTPQTNSDGYIPQCSDDKGRMHFVSVYKLEKKKNENAVHEVVINKWEENEGKKKKNKKGTKKNDTTGADPNANVNTNTNANANATNNVESKQIKKKVEENLNNEHVEENGTEKYINMNEQLVEKGLAKVMKHRQDDDKAENYYHLQELEKEAEEKKVGRFSPNVDIIKINNISGNENAQRARSFENVLNKFNNLNATVDFIYSANKYKLYIPSQNLLINFILLGINIQKINLKELSSIELKHKQNHNHLNAKNHSLKNDQQTMLTEGGKVNKKEKLEYKEIALQAYMYTRKMLMQRNVQISIMTCDKGGNFIGILKIKNKDYAIHLLSLGYGTINELGLNNTSERNSYVKAAEEAKKKKKNIWAIEKSEEDNNNTLNNETDLLTYDNIYYCSYVSDVDNICVQLKSKQEELKKLQDEINKIPNLESSSNYILSEINKNTLVVAKYIDNCYYRALILQVNKHKKKAVVKYIDFGNEDEVDFVDIKKLSDQFSLKTYPGFGIKVALSGLKMPLENKNDLIIYIQKLLLDKYLYVKFEKKITNVYHVVFYDYEQFTSHKNVRSVNEEIVFNGICYVDNLSDTKIFEKLKKEEV